MCNKFSVLLSLYHAESSKFLEEALASVWWDQSLKPSQIVLVIDGPIGDDLERVVNRWQAERSVPLDVIRLPSNVGLAAALNKGLEYCYYDLVARMDTDDVCLPNRFEIQIDYLNSNPSVSVVGGQVEEWNESFDKKLNIRRLPVDSQELYSLSKRRNPLSHPSVTFRRDHVLEAGGYPLIYPEDYILWVNMLSNGRKLANVDQPLVKMRTGASFYQRRGYKFLKGEIAIYRYMYGKRIISIGEFLRYSSGRVLLRLAPGFLKVMLYKYCR